MRIEHADLNNLIDHSIADPSVDELALRRLKKRRLGLRDEIARLEGELNSEASPQPDEPA